MTYCSCWCEYPNKNYKQKNGKWKCVDRYKCIRPREDKRKTMCECIKPRVKMVSIPIDSLSDCISRQAVLDLFQDNVSTLHNYARVWEAVEEMLCVTPEELIGKSQASNGQVTGKSQESEE